MKILFALSISILFIGSAFGQSIVSGPVVGGVTSNSSRIYLRTNQPMEVDIELDTLSNFATSFMVSDSTRNDNFGVMIANVEGLQSFKKYYYKFTVNGVEDTTVYQFTSFPEEGDSEYLKVLVGSCNYFENLPLFQHIEAFDPMLFIHLGDWRFPPSIYGWDYNLYPDLVAESFSFRFNDVNMKNHVLPNCAIDYVYDDAYCHNGNQGPTHPQIQVVELAPDSFFFDLQTVSFNPGVIPGAINGYFKHFPGYEAVDTSIGIHHSFKMGNVEFFMLDLRNSASPQHEAFVYHPDTNRYTFEPGPDHSLMSSGQREWLLDGLSNSTADWKIIGSSLMFNKRFAYFMEVLMVFQGFDESLITRASDLSYFWHAYPADQLAVLDHIDQNGIEDVIVISGDSHSSMVDDGTNAGLPELSASGLSSEDEGYLNWSLDSVIALTGLPYLTPDSVWNGGGNGVGNTNFSDSYGTMEFFGKDSLKLCAMDELGQTMGCVTIYHASSTTGIQSNLTLNQDQMYLVYPNPTKDRIQVQFLNGYKPSSKAVIQLTDLNGRLISKQNGAEVRHQMEVDLHGLPASTYTLTLIDEGSMETKKVMVRGNQ